MSSECVDDDCKQWDYLCPQFIDFNATETTEQIKQMDHFFDVDHESEDQPSVYGEEVLLVSNTPVIETKTKSNSIVNEIKDPIGNIDDFKYETPPQNKENIEDDDNEVFYSTKKYLSVKKYKLRSTPMRTLQYNGNTPLKETPLRSKKKNKKTNSGLNKLGNESLFTMECLLTSLPIESNNNSPAIVEPTPQEDGVEVRIDIEEEVVYEIGTHSVSTIPQNSIHEKEDNEVFQSDNENHLPEEYVVNLTVNKRESYVIKKAPKCVTVISPSETSKISESNKKRFTNSLRRKGTPIRKSALSSGRKVSTQSIVSRLHSTTKKYQNQYKTMAELLKEFETNTRGNDRSRSMDRMGTGGQRSRSSSVSSITQPKSPKLHSIYRHRPTPRQTEDMIASQIKKYTFKANPIRKNLFEANHIPRVKSLKAPTKAVPMSFMTEKRNELRVNNQTTNGFEPEGEHKFKAHPMPAFKNPNILLPKSEKKGTTFKPFSFDDGIQKMVQKKRSQSEENIKRDFHRNIFKF